MGTGKIEVDWDNATFSVSHSITAQDSTTWKALVTQIIRFIDEHNHRPRSPAAPHYRSADIVTSSVIITSEEIYIFKYFLL